MKIQTNICLAVSLIFMGLSSFSQEGESLEDIFKVDYDTPLTLDLNAEEDSESEIEPVKQKKKKKKRNVFFGIKTKKAFVRTVRGRDVLYEIFHVLKEYEGPPEYASDFYWYDYKKKKIQNSKKVNKR